MIRGVLRRGGLCVGGIRGAAGYERQGNDGNAGEDNFFHKYVGCSDVFFNHARLGHQLVMGYGV